jgi:hypothetical protein
MVHERGLAVVRIGQRDPQLRGMHNALITD